jgi:hypothetical protein
MKTNDYCVKHEYPAGMYGGKPCPDCADLARKDEEIASLKESLRDVLEISEVEGAINLTVMESAKLMAARTLLGTESRFIDKRKNPCPKCGFVGCAESCQAPGRIGKRKCDGCDTMPSVDGGLCDECYLAKFGKERG